METPVLELVDLDHLYVEVLMPEATAHRVRIGQTVSVRVEREWMGRAGQIRGRVSYVSQTVDAASRMRRLKIDIEDPTHTVRPGMIAELQFGAAQN
jgi:multidrug efflux pump subunit AcrA (membrane-fusion protein)